MAFDGITIAALTKELRDTLLGGRLYKIAQPEKDELLFTIKNNGSQYRLLLSANPSLPLAYLTEDNKKSPLTAPNFCMLLRKHVQNARIVAITQPDLERVIHLHLEHLDEMGDLCQKILTIELMGKYSNIIFRDEEKIIDSMKHISAAVSSVREVLPGRAYFIPKAEGKLSLFTLGKANDAHSEGVNTREFTDVVVDYVKMCEVMSSSSLPAIKWIYQSFTGVAPIVAADVCYRAGVDQDKPVTALSEEEKTAIFTQLTLLADNILKGAFAPHIVYELRAGETNLPAAPMEFGVFPYAIYGQHDTRDYDSVSCMLASFYADKDAVGRIRQKSVDLRKQVQTAIERTAKKLDLQKQQLKDTEKRDKYKVYGELLHTYGYQVAEGAKEVEVENYYDGKQIKIPLNPDLTAMENAAKYFDRYGKLKRTYEALSVYSKETEEELTYLQSVMTSLDLAKDEEDLLQIKEELYQSGYSKKRTVTKQKQGKAKPLHYISSNGFHMYVGKNNLQNDDITFKLADGGDWWFHTKRYHGSHVIVKTEGKELPDATFLEAARLAAHYSEAGASNQVEIDYVQRKHVKKPTGSKPGFVVYYTNFSMLIDTDISGIKQITKE